MTDIREPQSNETTQSLEQTLLDFVRQLPLERQKQAVDFVRFLDIETRHDSDIETRHDSDEENDLLTTGLASLETS